MCVPVCVCVCVCGDLSAFREHPLHFAFVEEYRSLSEVLLDRFALKLRELLPPDLAMAAAFAVLTSPLEFMSSIGCRAPIGQPLRWRASFTQAVQRAFAAYCDAHVTLLEMASDNSADGSTAPDQDAKHTQRTGALLTELYECEETHLATLMQHWSCITDPSLVGTVLRDELRVRVLSHRHLGLQCMSWSVPTCVCLLASDFTYTYGIGAPH